MLTLLSLPLPPPQNTDGEASPSHPPQWPAPRICAGRLGRQGPKDVVSLDIATSQTCSPSELAARSPLVPGPSHRLQLCPARRMAMC